MIVYLFSSVFSCCFHFGFTSHSWLNNTWGGIDENRYDFIVVGRQRGGWAIQLCWDDPQTFSFPVHFVDSKQQEKTDNDSQLIRRLNAHWEIQIYILFRWVQLKCVYLTECIRKYDFKEDTNGLNEISPRDRYRDWVNPNSTTWKSVFVFLLSFEESNWTEVKPKHRIHAHWNTKNNELFVLLNVHWMQFGLLRRQMAVSIWCLATF